MASQRFDAATRRLAEAAAGPWAIPWPCVHEFLAIATHPRIFSPPTPLAAALEIQQQIQVKPTDRVLLVGWGGGLVPDPIGDKAQDKATYNEDAFARYLTGILYESAGDMNNAFIAYRKAYEAYEAMRGWAHTPVPGQLRADLFFRSHRHAHGPPVEPVLEHERQGLPPVLRFDYEVLHGYTPFDMSQLPTLDMMVDLANTLQHRLSLDSIATASLGVEKTSEGLQAIRWFREGKLLEIAEYCCYDVKITRLVHEYGQAHRQLYYTNKFGKILPQM